MATQDVFSTSKGVSVCTQQLSLASPGQTGSATIALTTSSVAVPYATATANTIVMAQISQAAVDATATAISCVSVTAGTGFTIHANAAATANLNVVWYVVKV